MTRKPAAPANLRNGLKWRDGRPRWEPSPVNRAAGFRGVDLKTHDGAWMDRGAATSAADARTYLAAIVRQARGATEDGGKARAVLRSALDRLPPLPDEPEARWRRQLVADLVEAGRAVLEDREPGVTDALSHGARTVNAMIDGFFADREAMRRLSAGTIRNYRTQSKKLRARFGPDRADAVTRPQMRQWYLDMQREVSIATANVAIGAAGAMFRWATWQDPAWLKDNPCDKIGRDAAPGRLVFWTPDEERIFVGWCDANGYADVADAVTVCIWTGARQIDVAAVADVSELMAPSWRYVPEKTKRKGQTALPGLLGPVHRRAERRAQAARNSASLRHLNAVPFLWDERHARRHTSETIGDRFREARKAIVAAGELPPPFLEKRLQDTRDTCVTRLWAAGVTIERIATWGGWSVETARQILHDHYLSLLEEGARETAAKLEAWAVAQGIDVAAA